MFLLNCCNAKKTQNTTETTFLHNPKPHKHKGLRHNNKNLCKSGNLYRNVYTIFVLIKSPGAYHSKPGL